MFWFFLPMRKLFRIIFYMKNSNYHMILIICVKSYQKQEPVFDLLVLNITSSKLLSSNCTGTNDRQRQLRKF